MSEPKDTIPGGVPEELLEAEVGVGGRAGPDVKKKLKIKGKGKPLSEETIQIRLRDKWREIIPAYLWETAVKENDFDLVLSGLGEFLQNERVKDLSPDISFDNIKSKLNYNNKPFKHQVAFIQELAENLFHKERDIVHSASIQDELLKTLRKLDEDKTKEDVVSVVKSVKPEPFKFREEEKAAILQEEKGGLRGKGKEKERKMTEFEEFVEKMEKTAPGDMTPEKWTEALGSLKTQEALKEAILTKKRETGTLSLDDVLKIKKDFEEGKAEQYFTKPEPVGPAPAPPDPEAAKPKPPEPVPDAPETAAAPPQNIAMEVKEQKHPSGEQKVSFADIPSYPTPVDMIPPERLTNENKSEAQLKADIKYFFTNFSEQLKSMRGLYKKMGKMNKVQLKRFHARIVGRLSPDAKTVGKKTGVVIDAEEYIRQRVNEVMIENAMQQFLPEQLRPVAPSETEQKDPTATDIGNYEIKRAPSGKLASQREPIYKYIPTVNEPEVVKERDTEPFVRKGPVRVNLLRSKKRTPVVTAKRQFNDDPFLDKSKTKRINKLF